jgi:hypothetical protein
MSLRERLPTVEFIQDRLRHDLARETTRQADYFPCLTGSYFPHGSGFVHILTLSFSE